MLVVTGYALTIGYRLVRVICKVAWFFTGNDTCKYISRLPTHLHEYWCMPMEKVKHANLVLVPISTVIDKDDRRPEMDRGERFQTQKFSRYRVAVEVRTDAGYRYYKEWIGSLPKQWYKDQGRTLKTVVVNVGLMATVLNRKTLLAARDHPEVALDTMTRLLSSNAHYQEDFGSLLENGTSAYRDMALCFGALVTRSPYIPNQNF